MAKDCFLVNTMKIISLFLKVMDTKEVITGFIFRSRTAFYFGTIHALIKNFKCIQRHAVR